MNKEKKNVSTGIISLVVINALSFITTSYLINSIGSTEYSYLSLANNFIGYFTLVTIALNSMAARFISVEYFKNETEESNKYFSTVFFVNLIFGILLIPICFAITTKINTFINVPDNLLVDVKILWALVFAQFIILNSETVIISTVYIKQRVELQYIRDIISALVRFVFLVSLFYINGVKLYYVGISYLASALVTTVVDVYFWKKISSDIQLSTKFFDFRYALILIKSGIWTVVEKIGHLLNSGLDLWIANVFIDPIAAGLLSVSKVFETMCQSIYSMVVNSYSPTIFKNFSEQDNESLEYNILYSTKVSYFITSLPSSFLIVFGDEFIKVLYPNENSIIISSIMSIRIISIIAASLLENTNTVFIAHNKLKRKSVITVISGLITNILLIIMLSTLTKNIIIIALLPSLVYIIKAIYINIIHASKIEGYSLINQIKCISKCLFSNIIVIVVFYAIKQLYVFNGFFSMVVFGMFTVILSCILQYMILFRKRG